MQTIFRRKKHTQILYSLKVKVHDLSASIYIWDDFWDYIYKMIYKWQKIYSLSLTPVTLWCK